ncbi:BTAD domain-containing putative transcriptional regulator [Catenuloplanes japonicus]|uniref:BTAD domain-containing putative transcriptional regulator n=1 Tax=Catenuloplanes japonicus TaxID=33876 RepID=UPI00068DFD72|nr:BTAD domain-containing putative transcriptional regulator [Catenuloplanes japonicus]
MEVRYAVLGPLTASAGDTEIDLGPAKQRAVLALLLLNANRPVSATAIVDTVWADDPPENGANVVQKHIAGLRRALEPDRSPRSPSTVLTLDGAGYRLHVPSGALDTDTFDSAVRAARAHVAANDFAAAASGLRGALRLWRGEALAGLGGRVFETERRRLDDARGAAWELLAEAELALGLHASLGAELVRVIEEFPAREELRCALLLAFYRQGRQAEALTAFREARDYLNDEFGVEPGERLQDLHRRILRSDPTLGPVVETAAVPVPPSSPAPPAVPSPPPAVAPFIAAAQQPDFTRKSWVMALLAGGTSLVTAGVFAWAIVGALGLIRRSLVHTFAGIVYGALTLTMWILADSELISGENEPFNSWDTVLVVGLIVPLFVGTGHAALLALFPRNRPGIQGDAGLGPEALREARRQQARQILTFRPDIAVELGIGRPDLFRWFDDGGLVDINAVPEGLMVTLPGVTATMARNLAVERARGGPFNGLHDLVARGALQPHRAYPLGQLLVFGGVRAAAYEAEVRTALPQG